MELRWGILVLQLKQRPNSDKKRLEQRRQEILNGASARKRNEKRLRELGVLPETSEGTSVLDGDRVARVVGHKGQREESRVDPVESRMVSVVVPSSATTVAAPPTLDDDEWIFRL